jgi:hypothetical protein
MRRLRVRFTIRRLMIAVALVAVSIAAWKEYHRCMRLQLEYRIRAEIFDLRAGLERTKREHPNLRYEIACRLSLPTPPKPEPPLSQADYDARMRYYTSMQAKYERAARFPWWPVAPDPPEPR